MWHELLHVSTEHMEKVKSTDTIKEYPEYIGTKTTVSLEGFFEHKASKRKQFYIWTCFKI